MGSFDVMHCKMVKDYLAIKRAKQALESQNEQSETKSLDQPKSPSQDDPQQSLEATPIRLYVSKTSSNMPLEASTPKPLISMGSVACFHCGSTNINSCGKGSERVNGSRGQRIKCKVCGRSSTIG